MLIADKLYFLNIHRAHHEGRISAYSFIVLLDAICKYQATLRDMLGYDWIPVPLVYTQVINIVIGLYSLLRIDRNLYRY